MERREKVLVMEHGLGLLVGASRPKEGGNGLQKEHADCSSAARWWRCRQSRASPVTCSLGAPAMRPPDLSRHS